MAETVICTGCRSPIQVPDDHPGDRIHCGICWAEVMLEQRKKVPPPAVAPASSIRPMPAVLLPKRSDSPSGIKKAPPLSGIRTADPLPSGSRPLPGMAPLEALILKAASRLSKPADLPSTTPQNDPVVEVVEVVVVDEPTPVAVTPAFSSPGIPPIPERMHDRPSGAPALTARAVVANDPVPVLKPLLEAESPEIPANRDSEARRPRSRDENRKSRYGRRDDDDERVSESRSRSTRTGPLVGVIIGGMITLLAMGVGVWWMIAPAMNPTDPADKSMTGQAAEEVKWAGNRPVADAKNAGQPLPPFIPPRFDDVPLPANPAPNPDDVIQNPRKPFKDPPWKPVEGADGFEAVMLGDARLWTHHSENLHDANFLFSRGKGKTFSANGPWFTFEIRIADAPSGTTPNLPKIVMHPFGKAEKVIDCQLAGHKGVEHIDSDASRTEIRRVIQVGCRVFVFRADLRKVFGRTQEDVDEAAKKFFDSVKIDFDPNTPAPIDGTLRPRAGGIVPAPGEAFPNLDPGMRMVARIDPFLSAVVLPGRNEVYTIGLRPGSRTLGILRVYSYPQFVPKHMYQLPAAGTFAVANEQTARLAITTVRQANDSPVRESDRAVVMGDMHIFDLNPLFKGSVGERDDLKPLATITFGAKLAGLELAPNGKTAFVLSLTPTPNNKQKPYRTRLTKIDLQEGKTLGDMELPDPAWCLAMSPDGSKLFAAEVPLNPFGQPLLAVARVANILVVNVAEWKREKTLTTPGAAFDLVCNDYGVLLASVSQGNGFKAYAVPMDGQTVDLTPANGRSIALGYCALTPDGKRMITSANLGQGLEVYSIANLEGPAGLNSLASARTVRGANPAEAPVPVGGNFTLSPDGKFAILNGGVVIDLSAIK